MRLSVNDLSLIISTAFLGAILGKLPGALLGGIGMYLYLKFGPRPPLGGGAYGC